MLVLAGCDGYFGKKTDLDFIEKPEFQLRDIAYVPVQPAIVGLSKPVDVLAGFDELIYAVDAGSEEIVCFDESGRELGRLYVQGVRAVAQDRKLDLLAIGTQTRNISGVDFDLTCIYRIRLQQPQGYGLQFARVVNTIVHPFYFKSTFSSSDVDVEFNDIAVLRDNRYYVTREGNVSQQFGGPDDAVLLFNENDVYVTPIAISSNGSLYNNYFKDPFGISSLIQPPQLLANGPDDFLFTSIDPNGVIKSQYIEVVETEFGVSYEPRVMEQDTSKADGFLTLPYRFTEPMGITLTGDGSNHIFITDRGKDSLYLFSLNGFEGVRPPAGYSSSRYVNVSFGGRGNSLMQFNQPMGVAYKNNIVYVADSGNGRILRFKLTSDFD
ncbi:MAG: hypothetical protein H6606_01485 [Flavobacteriales bacterium]|nr:hypothetical protein [Flavobacteriales bacterium]